MCLCTQLIEEFRDMPGKFGRQLPANGFKVHVVPGLPANGCSELLPPPVSPDTDGYKWVVLIARYDFSRLVGIYFTVKLMRHFIHSLRYNCTFEEKIRNAQLSGYDAAIVYNLDSNDLGKCQ